MDVTSAYCPSATARLSKFQATFRWLAGIREWIHMGVCSPRSKALIIPVVGAALDAKFQFLLTSSQTPCTASKANLAGVRRPCPSDVLFECGYLFPLHGMHSYTRSLPTLAS
jgi:hypothetical protein